MVYWEFYKEKIVAMIRNEKSNLFSVEYESVDKMSLIQKVESEKEKEIG